jgi:hypothetical protein
MKKSDRRVTPKLIVRRESVRVLALTDLVEVAGGFDSQDNCRKPAATPSGTPGCG